MKTLYFSFFGAVEAPEGSEIRRLRFEGPWIREARRIERRIRGRKPLWEQDGGGIWARAYRTRRKGVVLLLVECPAGGWMEAGEVFWPLRFREPAAVAGACCAPRYGLRHDALPPGARGPEEGADG